MTRLHKVTTSGGRLRIVVEEPIERNIVKSSFRSLKLHILQWSESLSVEPLMSSNEWRAWYKSLSPSPLMATNRDSQNTEYRVIANTVYTNIC